jgi:prepilin-type N-terminal cleavage/methylation domain-containing protein
MNARATARCGFTLIETLVTLSIFGLLMATLMGGLFGVTRSWGRADSSLVRNAELRAALDRWRADVESPHFELKPVEPLFAFAQSEDGKEALTLWRTSAHGDPAGAAMKVTWEIRGTENGGQWIRRAEAFIAGQPAGDPIEEVVVSSVGKIEFRFLSSGAWVDSWDQPTPPEAIQARAELAGAPRTISWSTAMISVGAAP